MTNDINFKINKIVQALKLSGFIVDDYDSFTNFVLVNGIEVIYDSIIAYKNVNNFHKPIIWSNEIKKYCLQKRTNTCEILNGFIVKLKKLAPEFVPSNNKS